MPMDESMMGDDPKTDASKKDMPKPASEAGVPSSSGEGVAEHTVQPDETLSEIALKYYGHATKPYWMHIYEHNKDAIGDNPGIVRVGTELSIPELPSELKD